MSNVKYGILWNSLQQFGQLGIAFLSTIVLARFLTPEDYGIYGILIIFVSISELFSDSGIAGYMIKKQNVTPIYYDTLFVYNMCVSIVMYSMLYIIAPFVAKFYGREIITLAIRVLGIVVLLHAFSITQYTRLLKNLQFKVLATISLFSGCLSFCIAFYLAYDGCGFWALIFQQIVLVLLTTVSYIIVNKNIPKVRFKLSVFKEQFSFGINLFLSSILEILTNNINNNLIAKFFSLDVTGLYVQSIRLQNYPLAMVSNVVDKTFFPMFSKINNDLGLLKEKVSQLRRLLYAVLFPVFAAIICFSYHMIYFVFGEKWIQCTPYFQILMLASFPQLVKVLNRNILKSLGYTRMIFKIELYSVLVLVMFLFVAFFIRDIYMVLIAVVAGKLFSAVLGSIYLSQIKIVSVKRQFLDFILFFTLIIIPSVIQFVVFNDLVFKVLVFVVAFLVVISVYTFCGCREYLRIFRMLRNSCFGI